MKKKKKKSLTTKADQTEEKPATTDVNVTAAGVAAAPAVGSGQRKIFTPADREREYLEHLQHLESKGEQ